MGTELALLGGGGSRTSWERSSGLGLWPQSLVAKNSPLSSEVLNLTQSLMPMPLDIE
jgi:hypothetical protein